jgi:tetratricopeptide (TPR) repeat protein
MESMAQTNPANVQNLVLLGSAYIQMQQSDRALKLFDVALARPEISVVAAQSIAQYCAQLGDLPRCQKAIEKLVALAPDQPEPHYDLAALDAVLGRSPAAMQELKMALDLNARRLAANPKATDLLETARTDDRLNNLRSLPEFQKIVPPK